MKENFKKDPINLEDIITNNLIHLKPLIMKTKTINSEEKKISLLKSKEMKNIKVEVKQKVKKAKFSPIEFAKEAIDLGLKKKDSKLFFNTYDLKSFLLTKHIGHIQGSTSVLLYRTVAEYCINKYKPNSAESFGVLMFNTLINSVSTMQNKSFAQILDSNPKEGIDFFEDFYYEMVQSEDTFEYRYKLSVQKMGKLIFQLFKHANEHNSMAFNEFFHNNPNKNYSIPIVEIENHIDINDLLEGIALAILYSTKVLNMAAIDQIPQSSIDLKKYYNDLCHELTLSLDMITA